MSKSKSLGYTSSHAGRSKSSKIVDRFILPSKSTQKFSSSSPTKFTKQCYSTLLLSLLEYKEHDKLSTGKLITSRAEEVSKKVEKWRKYQNQLEFKPFRRFHISGWKDNFYSNLLDWRGENIVCAASQNGLLLNRLRIDDDPTYKQCTRHQLKVSGQDISAIKCVQNNICIGCSRGSFKLYDIEKKKSIFEDYTHELRIASIESSFNLVFTGSKDQTIKIFDLRKKLPIFISEQLQNSHSQEICGIKCQGNFLASGGNDNIVFIYDLRKQKIFDSYNHHAAIKAMVWKDEKTLLTGGGTSDKKIKFWESGEGIVSQLQTGSQVCGLCWSRKTQEIISCQGFSLNQIIIWSKECERLKTIHGHSNRVLYSALSPSGQYLASGAGDKTLKIWNLFSQSKEEEPLSLR